MPVKVPRVILDDPNVEPTDEELELLMLSFQETVIRKRKLAEEKLRKELIEDLEKVGNNNIIGTVSSK